MLGGCPPAHSARAASRHPALAMEMKVRVIHAVYLAAANGMEMLKLSLALHAVVQFFPSPGLAVETKAGETR